MRFTWDPAKEHRNRRKHGVAFQEATSVFGDPLAATIIDPDHLIDEARLLTIGQSASGQVLVVCHVEQGDTIRIISARRATIHERQDYEKQGEGAGDADRI